MQAEIAKSNERLLEARKEKLEAARKRVQELNARFADWYYLIDDASFKQLMLKRDVLIGPRPATPAGSWCWFPRWSSRLATEHQLRPTALRLFHVPFGLHRACLGGPMTGRLAHHLNL